MASVLTRLTLYYQLLRLDKPIGILLLLWPTLCGLWIASDGQPSLEHLFIFSIGTVLMRSAGCAVNDYADQDFDKHVKRTAERPITSGKIRGREALLLAFALSVMAFLLITPLNLLTRQLSVAALLIAASYPYFKRFFAIPQAYLGIAFGFGIPMSFAAVQNTVPMLAWVLLLGNVFWAIAYDTEYALVDKEDDLKIGIRTSAISFGSYDIAAIMLCYVLYLSLLAYAGWQLALYWPYWLGLTVAGGCALYHYFLIRERDRMACFAAFRHNNWLGAAIFAGLVCTYALR